MLRMANPRVEQLRIVADHLLVERDGETYLIDTGVPDDMVAPAIASRMLGVPVDHLLGCRRLSRGPVTIDWPARELRHESSTDPDATIVPLGRLPLGIPSVRLAHDDAPHEAVLDTGAPLSYAPASAVAGLTPVRRTTDFFPMLGSFDVDVYRTTVQVGGVVLDLEVGVLPPLLQMALALLAPSGWILGAALFRDRVVTLDLGNDVMHVGALVVKDTNEKMPHESTNHDTHESDTEWQPVDSPASFANAVKGLHWQVRYDVARRAAGGCTVRALVELTGEGRAVERPVDVALVIDRSGSMAGAKLDAAIAAAHWMVDKLPEASRVAIVTFADVAQRPVELTQLTTGGRTALHEALRRIEAGGSTALADGWRRGTEALRDAGRAEPSATEGARRQRVLLLSDGHANVGERQHEVLSEWTHAAAQDAITTSTVGIGDGHDEDLLRALARAGSGSTWYVPDAHLVAEVLADELQSLQQTTATLVEARLIMDALASQVTVHGELTVGELSTAMVKPIVIEYVLAELPPFECTVGKLRLQWHGVASGRDMEEVPLMAFPAAVANATVRAAWWRLRMAALRVQSVAAADKGRHIEARRDVEALVASVSREDPRVRDLLAADLDTLRRLRRDLDARRNDTRVRKHELQRSYNAFTGKRRYDERLKSW
jgi:Ca-activated chloride channel family protein